MKRRTYQPDFKARVAANAIVEENVQQVAARFGLHPNIVRRWRNQLLDVLPSVFGQRKKEIS